MRTHIAVAAGLVAAALGGSPAAAQGGSTGRVPPVPPTPPVERGRPTAPTARTAEQTQANAFTWSGELTSGQRVIVRNLVGNIRVEAARGNTLEVVASKRWRRGRPADVSIDATRVARGDVLVCARWTDNVTCTEDTYRTRGGNVNNDTQVDFVIRLPAGANAVLHTTIGNLEATGIAGSVDAETTNGSIRIEAGEGPVQASTTNGHLDIRFTKLPPQGASYTTTNGSITVSLPDGTDADVDARTVNGRIDSDFPVTVTGSISRRGLRGTIGRGGPRLTLVTVNGSIRIEKR